MPETQLLRNLDHRPAPGTEEDEDIVLDLTGFRVRLYPAPDERLEQERETGRMNFLRLPWLSRPLPPGTQGSN
jgi:hypothetical protein